MASWCSMVPLHIAMKIQHQTKTKLELGGVAGTLRWMVALLLIGGAIMPVPIRICLRTLPLLASRA